MQIRILAIFVSQPGKHRPGGQGNRYDAGPQAKTEHKRTEQGQDQHRNAAKHVHCRLKGNPHNFPLIHIPVAQHGPHCPDDSSKNGSQQGNIYRVPQRNQNHIQKGSIRRKHPAQSVNKVMSPLP